MTTPCGFIVGTEEHSTPSPDQVETTKQTLSVVCPLLIAEDLLGSQQYGRSVSGKMHTRKQQGLYLSATESAEAVCALEANQRIYSCRLRSLATESKVVREHRESQQDMPAVIGAVLQQ